MVDASGSILNALDGCLAFLEKGQFGEAEVVLRYCRQAFFSNFCEQEDQLLNETIEKGMVHLSKMEVESALLLFQAAYKHNRRSRVAFVNICYCLFHLGKYEEFWTHYEDRLHHFDQLVTYRNIFDPDKRWDGETDLNGKRVIIFGEQGLGDCIMFARYLPRLKERYPEAHIVLNASKVLQSLFENHFKGFDEFLAKEKVQIGAVPFVGVGEVPIYDYHFPIMSFPFLLKEYEPKQEIYCSNLHIHISKLIPAGNPSVNKTEEECLSKFYDDPQTIYHMVKAWNNKSKAVKKDWNTNKDSEARHTFREHIIGARLKRCGYNVKYEVNVDNKNPDWFDKDAQLLVEHYNKERPNDQDEILENGQVYTWFPTAKNLGQRILDKIDVYKTVVEKNNLRFVISVYADFGSGIDFCMFKEEVIRSGIFSRENLSGLIFFTDSPQYKFNYLANPIAKRPIDLSSIENVPLRVGFIHRGNPASGNENIRSCDINHFRKLLNKNVELHLIHHEDSTDISRVINHAPIKDFLELYKIIESMDLIVAVDTAAVHLAGAMGKKVIMATPYVPDWRWKLMGDKTVWYKSVTIIRQEFLGDWDGVFSQILEQIQRLTS